MDDLATLFNTNNFREGAEIYHHTMELSLLSLPNELIFQVLEVGQLSIQDVSLLRRVSQRFLPSSGCLIQAALPTSRRAGSYPKSQNLTSFASRGSKSAVDPTASRSLALYTIYRRERSSSYAANMKEQRSTWTDPTLNPEDASIFL